MSEELTNKEKDQIRFIMSECEKLLRNPSGSTCEDCGEFKTCEGIIKKLELEKD